MLARDGADESPWLHVDRRESSVMRRCTGQEREPIEQALPYQLGAETSHRFAPDGVSCTIAIARPTHNAGAR
ncbi:MAG: hypothetical protein WA418_27415 [Bradyrhizobium sp.]